MLWSDRLVMVIDNNNNSNNDRNNQLSKKKIHFEMVEMIWQMKIGKGVNISSAISLCDIPCEAFRHTLM
jgi:hypothetical protein